LSQIALGDAAFDHSESDSVKQYVLAAEKKDVPGCLTDSGQHEWKNYIKPVLKSLQKEKYRVSILITIKLVKFNDLI
jgi:galactokinase